jgi:hypothetical protein
MNAWLSRQAVARLTDLLAVLAAVPHPSDEHRCHVHSWRGRIEELMPADELLVLAGVLREATSCPGLSAATRTDCWSWSSYLERLLVGGPTTVTAMTTPPAGQARPERNVVLVPRVDRDAPSAMASA